LNMGVTIYKDKTFEVSHLEAIDCLELRCAGTTLSDY